MAAKKHKPKKSSITKAAAAATSRRRQEWPWSELPPITNSSLHPLHLNLASGPAVTKSRPPPPTRCDAAQRPRPRLRHVATSKEILPFYDSRHPPLSRFLADGSTVADAVRDFPGASHWCYLRSGPNPEPGPMPEPPPRHLYNYTFLGPNLWLRGVSLGPNAPTSALAVHYTINRAVTRYLCWYKEASIRHECTTPDPFATSKRPMEFTCLVELRGKHYATSLQGALVVMEVIDTRLKITGMGENRGVPSSDSRFFKEYLCVVKGEILLVFLIHERSLDVVDRVEVFRLDLDRLCWIKFERLNGKTLFLDERCIWVDSDKFGCRDDRVYFTQGLEKSWRAYDMKSCCILPVFGNENGPSNDG